MAAFVGWLLVPFAGETIIEQIFGPGDDSVARVACRSRMVFDDMDLHIFTYKLYRLKLSKSSAGVSEENCPV